MTLRADAAPFVPGGGGMDMDGFVPYDTTQQQHPEHYMEGDGQEWQNEEWQYDDQQQYHQQHYPQNPEEGGGYAEAPPHNNTETGGGGGSWRDGPQYEPNQQHYPSHHRGSGSNAAAYYPSNDRSGSKKKKKKPITAPPPQPVKIAAIHPNGELLHSGSVEPKALLTEDSAFMLPLRNITKASLPHIKLDQRYGRKGIPASALPQFIIAPMVANYRPVHFHDVSPGDLLEFHYDLALVLQHIQSAHTITFSFGKEWKQFCAPYAFLHCANYEEEVKKLVPSADANNRVEFVWDDDVVKDITYVVLEELPFLKEISLYQAMAMRIDLFPLYEMCYTFFCDFFPNYEVQFRDIFQIPSRIVVKASGDTVKRAPADVCLTDTKIRWRDLPNMPVSFTSGAVPPANPITDATVLPPLSTNSPGLKPQTVEGDTTAANTEDALRAQRLRASAPEIQPVIEQQEEEEVEEEEIPKNNHATIRLACVGVSAVFIAVAFVFKMLKTSKKK